MANIELRATATAVFAFIVAFLLLAVPLFLVTLTLAGPHSDLLPGFLRPVVFVAAWATLLGLPAWVAVRAYRWQRDRLRRSLQDAQTG